MSTHPIKKARIDADSKKPRARFADSSSKQEQRPKKKKVVIVKEPSIPPKNKGKARQSNTPDAETTTDNQSPSTFKIIAGSYEKLLYGIEGQTTYSNDDKKLQFILKPVFAFTAHVSCIKTVAASPSGGKWLATGSADEIIKVWDLRRRKEIGGLMHHEGNVFLSLKMEKKTMDPMASSGSITHLVFSSRSHLFSASDDGTLCLFHARDWTVLRSLKGHKGRINSIAIHPSGKVALSVGKDRALRMWDLMRGKGVASTKLGQGTLPQTLNIPTSILINTITSRGRNRPMVSRRKTLSCSIWINNRSLQYRTLTSSNQNFTLPNSRFYTGDETPPHHSPSISSARCQILQTRLG